MGLVGFVEFVGLVGFGGFPVLPVPAVLSLSPLPSKSPRNSVMLATADDEVFLGLSEVLFAPEEGSASCASFEARGGLTSGEVAVGSGAAGAGADSGSADIGTGVDSGSATGVGSLGAVPATPSELDVVGSWELSRDAWTVDPEEDASPLVSEVGGVASTVPSLSAPDGAEVSVGRGVVC